MSLFAVLFSYLPYLFLALKGHCRNLLFPYLFCYNVVVDFNFSDVFLPLYFGFSFLLFFRVLLLLMLLFFYSLTSPLCTLLFLFNVNFDFCEALCNVVLRGAI